MEYEDTEVTFGVPASSGLPQNIEKNSFMDSTVTADMMQDFISKFVLVFSKKKKFKY